MRELMRLPPALVERGIRQMARVIAADEVWLIGIERGGARLAEALAEVLQADGCCVHLGRLDITFYRDDLRRIGPDPEVRPSHLPFELDGRTIWLVDDVLFTGRTIRAALGELFDYGRPACVRLAVLVVRPGRELPIRADLAPFSLAPVRGGTLKLALCNERPCLIERIP